MCVYVCVVVVMGVAGAANILYIPIASPPFQHKLVQNPLTMGTRKEVSHKIITTTVAPLPYKHHYHQLLRTKQSHVTHV